MQCKAEVAQAVVWHQNLPRRDIGSDGQLSSFPMWPRLSSMEYVEYTWDSRSQ